MPSAVESPPSVVGVEEADGARGANLMPQLEIRYFEAEAIDGGGVEGIVAWLLTRLISTELLELDPADVRLQLLRGRLELRNARLRTAALERLMAALPAQPEEHSPRADGKGKGDHARPTGASAMLLQSPMRVRAGRAWVQG
ncbi:hypothetical protein T492DRAFT_866105 [Pavlovales sp. CCMP2436]|nr:hypothetical protein T492DRAFT_866105 [Pavlovales sp. CCMP2436]